MSTTCSISRPNSPFRVSDIEWSTRIAEVDHGPAGLRGRKANGRLIAKVIQDLTGARLLTAHGTLYRALHRLEHAGFLESFWEDPRLALEQGRPTRRFYRVTAAGEQALAQAREAEKIGLPSLTPRRATP